MKKSNCCNASLIDDSDICSACKEHCQVIDYVALKSNMLKQFDKSDLIHVLATFLASWHDQDFVDVLIANLHFGKYKRLVDLDKKKVDEFNAKYKQYEGKTIPKKLEKAYDRFYRGFEQNRKQLLKQRELMKTLGIVNKQQ